MKQKKIKFTVILEEKPTPDAPQRLAAAFTMLLGPQPADELPPDQALDSND